VGVGGGGGGGGWGGVGGGGGGGSSHQVSVDASVLRRAIDALGVAEVMQSRLDHLHQVLHTYEEGVSFLYCIYSDR